MLDTEPEKRKLLKGFIQKCAHGEAIQDLLAVSFRKYFV
jgi:hypothetical protein